MASVFRIRCKVQLTRFDGNGERTDTFVWLSRTDTVLAPTSDLFEALVLFRDAVLSEVPKEIEPDPKGHTRRNTDVRIKSVESVVESVSLMLVPPPVATHETAYTSPITEPSTPHTGEESTDELLAEVTAALQVLPTAKMVEHLIVAHGTAVEPEVTGEFITCLDSTREALVAIKRLLSEEVR
jgi:hypothetical protein